MYDSSTGLFMNSWRSGRGYSFTAVGKVFSRLGYVLRALATLQDTDRARMRIVEFSLRVGKEFSEGDIQFYGSKK